MSRWPSCQVSTSRAPRSSKALPRSASACTRAITLVSRVRSMPARIGGTSRTPSRTTSPTERNSPRSRAAWRATRRSLRPKVVRISSWRFVTAARACQRSGSGRNRPLVWHRSGTCAGVRRAPARSSRTLRNCPARDHQRSSLSASGGRGRIAVSSGVCRAACIQARLACRSLAEGRSGSYSCSGRSPTVTRVGVRRPDALECSTRSSVRRRRARRPGTAMVRWWRSHVDPLGGYTSCNQRTACWRIGVFAERKWRWIGMGDRRRQEVFVLITAFRETAPLLDNSSPLIQISSRSCVGDVLKPPAVSRD